MGKIVITDGGKLREAIQFAEKAGCLDQFGRDLCRFISVLTAGMKPADPTDNSMAEVFPDWAPHSFSWVIWRNCPVSWPTHEEKFVLNGGWIYAGPGAPGDGSAPSFSVNLDWVTGQAPKHSWSVHT